MFISILICTRDRTYGLQHTLESIFSLSNLEVPDWEVIIVYGPVDKAEIVAICREFQGKFPAHFRFLFEKKPGKSNALNTGTLAAKGNILALTDDDVVCGPDYIKSIRAVFSQYSVDGVQGRIFLDCEGGLPEWMDRERMAFMSLRDFGDEVIEWNDNLAGTSMVVRRDVIQKIGGFSPELGAGTAVGFREDSEFSWRMRKAGCRLIYAPQIVVRHQLSRTRLTKSFFRKRYFQWGRSEAYLRELTVPLWRLGLYTVRHFAWGEVKAIWYQGEGQAALALGLRCDTRYELGFFWQHWLFKRGLPRQLSLRLFLL